MNSPDRPKLTLIPINYAAPEENRCSARHPQLDFRCMGEDGHRDYHFHQNRHHYVTEWCENGSRIIRFVPPPRQTADF